MFSELPFSRLQTGQKSSISLMHKENQAKCPERSRHSLHRGRFYQDSRSLLRRNRPHALLVKRQAGFLMHTVPVFLADTFSHMQHLIGTLESASPWCSLASPPSLGTLWCHTAPCSGGLCLSRGPRAGLPLQKGVSLSVSGSEPNVR